MKRLKKILCKNETYCKNNDQRSNEFIFGEDAHILFLSNIKTINFELFEIYAYSPKDREGIRLSKNFYNVTDKSEGQIKIQVSIAGPSSLVGLNFQLKFIFENIYSKRILENNIIHKNRMLSEDVKKVSQSNVNIRANPEVNPTKETKNSRKVSQNDSKLKFAENIIIGLIGVTSVGLVLITTLNILEIKKGY